MKTLVFEGGSSDFYLAEDGGWRYRGSDGGQRKAIIIDCPQCGRSVAKRRKPTSGPNAGVLYCGRRCKNLAMWAERGGRRPLTKKDGYQILYSPDHPRASRAGYMFVHRLVMEDAVGRYLEPYEQVHHINGDRADNRLENLELWKRQQPPGVRSSDYHCPGCVCEGHDG